MNKTDVVNLIQKDAWMMKVLHTAKSLDLSDWMIGAGFVRNKVWDYLLGYQNKQVPTNDIDLIYFDPRNTDEEQEKIYDDILRQKFPLNWSCKNQARMHKKHKDRPYKNSKDALAHWVETATCIAVKLNEKDELELIAPYGVDDLVNLILRPSPYFHNEENIKYFYQRIKEKAWLKQYPKLKIKT